MDILTAEDKSRSFHVRWRAIQKDPDPRLAPLPLQLSATFTVDGLVPYLGCFLAQRGLLLRPTVAPYNQVYQTLLSSQASDSRLTVVLPRLEDLCARPLAQLATLAPDAIASARAMCRTEIEQFCAALASSQERTGTPVMCGTLPPPAHTPLGVLDAGHPASFKGLLRELNDVLFRHAVQNGVLVFDFAGSVEAFGSSRAYDDRFLYLARSPFSDEFLRTLGYDLSRAIAPLFIAPAKVLVLDLDNTLWGGVVGEDGLSGLRLGDAGIGAAFVDFQDALLALRAQGVLLCVASKNNEADAAEVFERHPNMRIRTEHLSATRINWNSKSVSLRELAEELSLGLESFVFVDDNPAECAEVRSLLPQVTVLELTCDPVHFVRALRSVHVLDRMVLTTDDRARAARYAEERARRAMAPIDTTGDPDRLKAHLEAMELKVVVHHLRQDDAPRAAQLTQKTNQFNLTTVRRSEADINALLHSRAHRLYSVDVSDRFGEYGLTGLAIVTGGTEPASFVLDTLLLSCRVLGRGVETALLWAILGDLEQQGGVQLTGRFIATAKNQPASAFLESHGFLTRQSEEAVVGTRTPLAPQSLLPAIEYLQVRTEFEQEREVADSRPDTPFPTR